MKIIQKLSTTLLSTLKSLQMIAPMLFGVIGLVGLFETFITPDMLHVLFTKHALHDTFIGTLAGAISVGQPFLSYIIGGELLKEGISFYAVTAFILSFVTLGIIQLPLELSIFGARFTIWRNILSILFAFIVAWLTTITIHFLNTILA